MEERVQKLMAKAGLGSRRENEALIKAGRVRINGRVARLGDKADPDNDTVELDGKLLELQPAGFIYVALHKPKGVISSLDDELEQGRRTVRDLVAIPGHLYPVGRLDKQSTGLMLLTNDGDLAHRLTHPRYGHEKSYEVELEGELTPEHLELWQKGIRLDGRKTIPARIRILQQERAFTRIEIVMREGRKRQIRRIAAILGYPVRQLIRRKIGSLALGDLAPGKWRHLTKSEIRSLKRRPNSGKSPQPGRSPGPRQIHQKAKRKPRWKTRPDTT